MIITSPTVAQVYPALFAVQHKMQPLVKDRKNTHTDSKYVTLDAIRDTLRPLLFEAGLLVVQSVGETTHHPTTGVITTLAINTRFIHAASGEWVENRATVAVAEQGKDERRTTPHTTGSAITYACRYSLVAAFSLSTEEDDDGNGDMKRPKTKQRVAAQKRHQKAVSKLNEAGITKLGDIPFPAEIKTFKEYAGTPLRDVPEDVLGKSYQLCSEHPESQLAKKYAKTFEDYLESRRLEKDRNDFTKPPKALAPPPDDLPFQ